MIAKTAFALAATALLVACSGGSENSSSATTRPETTQSSSISTQTSVDGESSTTTAQPGVGDVLAVPGDFDTIQAAVDASLPGDVVLISPGVYHEAVNVTTDEITIRGLDRNEVVLDGAFELDNGIRVLGASGVAVENLTVQSYTNNGVFWTGVEGYRASYVTLYRNGDYGAYAFDSINGLLEHSYASGSRGGGFYIGQCFECNALVDDVIAEYNGLGYFGANSGGNLHIVNSRFNNNRAGIKVNSGTYELCYPQRETTIVGNTVYDNNQPDTPSIRDALLVMYNGIVVEGGIGNVIERNLVADHDRVGIAVVPFVEQRPVDVEPSEETWSLPCSQTREFPLADPDDVEPIYWRPLDNRVVGNVVAESGVADIALIAVDADLDVIDPGELGNCFGANEFESTAPTDLEGIAPCEGVGSGGDHRIGELDYVGWFDALATAPPSMDGPDAPTPARPVFDGMPDAATAPSSPAIGLPPSVDLAAIVVPSRP
ncbi:MAG: right-handed parallel beta-helix repeat-containing protein [Ilumatobacteraceae bacterium]